MNLLVYFSPDASGVEKMQLARGFGSYSADNLFTHSSSDGADVVVTTDVKVAVFVLESGGPRVIFCSSELNRRLRVIDWGSRLAWSRADDVVSLSKLLKDCQTIKQLEFEFANTKQALVT